MRLYKLIEAFIARSNPYKRLLSPGEAWNNLFASHCFTVYLPYAVWFVCLNEEPSKTVTSIYNIVNYLPDCLPSTASVVIILRVSASLAGCSGCKKYHPGNINYIWVVIIRVLVVLRQLLVIIRGRIFGTASVLTVVLIVNDRCVWLRGWHHRRLLFDRLRIVVVVCEVAVGVVGCWVTCEALLDVVAEVRVGEWLRVLLFDHHHIIWRSMLLLLTVGR